MPTLRVVDAEGNDWSAKVDAPEVIADGVTAKLRGEKGMARLAVEQMDYAWTLPDGRSVTGVFQFRDLRFQDMNWQLTRTDKLIVYHVTPLKAEDLKSWEVLLNRAVEWTGQPRAKPLTIWVFPDYTSLNEWARLTDVAGLWFADVQRLVVYDTANTTDRQTILFHEMVHACTPGAGPSWYQEGLAQLLESRQERLLRGDQAVRWLIRGTQLRSLQTFARRRRVDMLDAIVSDGILPTDPYTLGVSFWLFVRRNQGEAGVTRFIAEGGGNNGIQNTLEAMFGKPLKEIWDDWNTYLRGPDLLQDWKTP